ncbi:MAG: PilW family protein, partial [Polaromonas sp.]
MFKNQAARSCSRRRSLGLTLVELLVALAISAVIALAAISALIVSRQGFTTVDAASQLRDNARFAT